MAKLDLEHKIKTMTEIYAEFESLVRDYRRDAACRPGCCFCCSGFGYIDIITLEGVVIREHLKSLSQKAAAVFQKRIDQNKKEKEKDAVAVCPFLNDMHQCEIYEVRPFSCRKLYSVKKCDEQGPTLHRDANVLAADFIRRLQRLDDTGYSGHISFVLHLLGRSKFRKIYLSGRFEPARIQSYGKSHNLIINRMAV